MRRTAWIVQGIWALLTSAPVWADVPLYPSFDETYFENVSISTTTRLLTVESLPYQIDQTDTWKLRYYSTQAGQSSTFCSLSRGFAYFPLTLDCGLRVFGFATQNTSILYYFLLKSESLDRYEIFMRPDASETVWLDKDAAGKTYTVLTLSDWLASGTSLQNNPQTGENSFEIHAAPDAASDVLLSRTSGRYAFGKLPEDGYASVDRSRSAVASWIPVEWIRSGCVPSQKTQVFCETAPSGNAPEGEPCVRGWVRWLTSEGKPRYYPFFTSAGSCPTKKKSGLYD